VNGSEARPISWVEEWTFRAGTTNLVFQRDGENGSASVLRYDTGGGHYVLRRE
jgi:hypothetical protein